MARRVGQHDLVRQARLNEGCCPTHGIDLAQVAGSTVEDGVLGCPRFDCDFEIVPKRGTKLYKFLYARKKRCMNCECVNPRCSKYNGVQRS